MVEVDKTSCTMLFMERLLAEFQKNDAHVINIKQASTR